MRPAYYCVQGFKVPLHFPQRIVEEAINYQPKDTDVFIASYPKCGSTWLHAILYLLNHEGEPAVDKDLYNATVPFIERDGLTPKYDYIKTHLPCKYLTLAPQSKYIYIIRDPRDVCVSFFHHCKSIPGYQFEEGQFKNFYDAFLEGDLPFGSYMDHFEDWYPKKDLQNVLFLTYEELKRNTMGMLTKLTTFLGLKVSKSVLEKVVRESSFTKMKKNINDSQENLSNDNFIFDIPKPVYRPELVRKGIVGDWKNYLTEKQNRQFKEQWGERFNMYLRNVN